MKIVADAHIPFVENYFGPCGEIVLIPGREISHSHVKNADILLVRSITKVNQALLEHTSVKFVGSVTAGEDHIDKHFLQQAGIALGVAKGFNAPPVADYVVSVIAALQQAQLFIPQQKKALIVGMGRVGRLVEQHLQTLGMEVSCCDPIRAELEADFAAVNLDDIETMDLITVHVPLTRKDHYPTYHLINKNILQKQPKNSVLINASRGAVINQTDLLEYGKHLTVCLDVFNQEPDVDKSVLQQAIITTPHIAGYSVQSKTRGIEMIYQSACAQHIIVADSERIPPTFPAQQLKFSDKSLGWQDIILGIFNPLLMTTLMKSRLLPASTDLAVLFDQLRNEFTYRHEFAFTQVEAELNEADKKILQGLGVQVGK